MKIKKLTSGLALSLFIGLSVQAQIASASGTSTADLLVLAEGNNTMAQRTLGERYAMGTKDVNQDLEQAAFWFTKVADKGDAQAQQYLGFAYSRGLGVPQDWVQAHMWLSLAGAASKKKLAPQDKELVEQTRKFAETKMTPKQIEEAQALVNEWLEKHKLPDQMATIKNSPN